jgi:preprotein translocase subunit SecG
MSVLLAILLIFTSIFLILLVLIQRGRGGGLAGAFGGLGGQSAFGTKAGDLFTRVTIGIAAFWIVLCVVSVKVMGSKTNMFTGSGPTQQAPGGTTTDTGAAAPSKSESTDKGATDKGATETGTAEKAPAEGSDRAPPIGTSSESAPKTDGTESAK